MDDYKGYVSWTQHSVVTVSPPFYFLFHSCCYSLLNSLHQILISVSWRILPIFPEQSLRYYEPMWKCLGVHFLLGSTLKMRTGGQEIAEQMKSCSFMSIFIAPNDWCFLVNLKHNKILQNSHRRLLLLCSTHCSWLLLTFK